MRFCEIFAKSETIIREKFPANNLSHLSLNPENLTCFLKVGGNEEQCGSGRSQMLDNGLGPWRSRFIFNLNMQFLSKMSYFRFRL